MIRSDILKYWSQGADDAFETASALIKLHRYHHALFFCHLAVEKLLKLIVVKKSKSAPLPIHNLLQLAKQANIHLSSDQLESIREINRFNIEARYDDYKLKFYKKATKDYALIWYKITQALIVWLKKN